MTGPSAHSELSAKFGMEPVHHTLELRVKKRFRGLLRFSRFVRSELRARNHLPLATRLRSWRLGFFSSSYLLYELGRNDPALYLPDDVSLVDAINNPHLPTLFNKLSFSRLMELYGMPHPQVYALLHQGRAHLFGDNGEVGNRPRQVIGTVLEEQGRLVLKPAHEYGGQGILFVDDTGETLSVNGIPTDIDEFVPLLSHLEHYYVSEYVVQADYAQALFPETTNTLRLLTLWDFDQDEPFLAAAAQRIGSTRSFPVDNFHQGRGGLSATIDLSNGMLGKGATMLDDGSVERLARHPETDAQIEGVVVPQWSACCEQILSIAARLPQIPYVGWDLVASEGGTSCIEANCPPSFPVWQVNQPLLADPRRRRSFEAMGLI